MGDAPVCAYCRQQRIDPKWRPFCSERCKMADLGRWLRGDYRIPGPAAEPWPDEAPGPPGKGNHD
jgi:uncharacterized protein